MTNRDQESAVSSTKAYYDGPADQIYRTIWGDNIHLGVPCGDDCPHPEAMEHTNQIMAQAVNLTPETRVLDLGCGRALSSIYLHREYGVQVWATDLWFTASENIQRVRDAGVEDGVFPIRADARSLPH